MAERSKTLNCGSELEIAQVQIPFVTVALFISTIDLVLVCGRGSVGGPENRLTAAWQLLRIPSSWGTIKAPVPSTKEVQRVLPVSFGRGRHADPFNEALMQPRTSMAISDCHCSVSFDQKPLPL
ncbi:hypothetical protein J6590_003031 [Homalodisca vitripennis]|nr:hypothetical protein J6590_003031 [Homalodisca vitripennis]